MDYKQTISYLFPTAVIGTDYTLYFPVGQTTPQILNWNTTKLGTQPTVDVLQQAWDSVLVQQARDAQLVIIAAASAAAQTSGFTSDALGSTYSYPSGLADQANLTAVITASLISGQPADTSYLFWCKDASGTEGFVGHTASQIQKVGLDGMAAVMAAKQKQQTLAQQIAAATTVAEVQAVVW
jgi:hypothetical protein